MEIQLVHTTGSPSRHDSDSESSYDKNRQLKSTSEMALHRKQSRRCKKQMSERQRRKRMNNSMDKLGLLVYGKSFKDGLKVDKATLLKDAYERLQTMKDDYHKGYETAITSTQTFLDRLDGCPQGVKDALTRHLHTTLQHHLHRCHSSPHPPEDALSDSCSPRPMNSTEARSGQEILLRDADQASSDLSPRGYRPMYMGQVTARKDTPRSARFGSRQEGVRSVPLGDDLRPSPSVRVVHDVKPPCGPVPVDFKLSPSLGAVHDVKPVADFKLSPSLAAVHDVEPPCRPTADLKKSSCRTTPGVGTPTFRAVGETVLLSAYTHTHAASGRGEGEDRKSSTACPPVRVSAVTTASASRPGGSWDSASVQSVEPRTPRQGHGDLYCPPTYPFPYLYARSSTPCSSTPRISPYVTHFAPQDPLYLGSTPPALVHTFPVAGSPSRGGPEVKPSPFLLSAHPHPAPHPLPAHTPVQHAAHIQARYGGSSSSSRAAEDSGYMSAVVPSSPFTPQNVAQYGGVKKRYLREMVRGERGMEETDEENDKEVERVFSAGSKYDSDSGSGFSE